MNQAGGNPRRKSGGCRGGSIVSVTQAYFICSAERNDREGAGLLCSQGRGGLVHLFLDEAGGSERGRDEPVVTH